MYTDVYNNYMLVDIQTYVMITSTWCLTYRRMTYRRGAGIAQWSERRTRDRKGSSPGRSGGRIFFSRVNFLCWLLFRYPFHPRVTAVVRKRSQSFCQKCRWQVTAKNTYTLPMWLWMKWNCNLVHGWMVYTEPAPKRQHFTWYQPCNTQRTLLVITSVDINNMRYKRILTALYYKTI